MAIVIVLLALAAVGIFNLYYSLQQKELDSKAEVIYVAAQDQMTKVMAAGRKPFMQPKASSVAKRYATLLGGRPEDSYPIPGEDEEVDPGKNYVEEDTIAYLTSKDLRDAQGDASVTNAASILFGNGGLDDELLSQNWIVEYDYKSLTVYAVFYSPDGDDASFAGEYGATYYNGYRFYNSRVDALKGGKRIGYHGGAGASSGGDSARLSPSVAIDNNEKLTATITCARPVEQKPVFLVTVSDGTNSYSKYYTFRQELDGGFKNESGFAVDRVSMQESGALYTLTLTLDSLESEKTRFKRLYGSEHNALLDAVDGVTPGKQRLAEGADITVSVEAWCNGNWSVLPGRASATDNSLFAKGTDDKDQGHESTALMACGRHLQNLDKSSGVSASNITKAAQTQGIDFTKQEDDAAAEGEDWFNAYGGGYFNGNSKAGIPLFKPIRNDNLASYDGQGNEVKGLYIGEASDDAGSNAAAGLFYSFEGSRSVTLKDMRLASPHVVHTASGKGRVGVGALAGLVSSNANLNISNCQVYLDTDDAGAKKAPMPSWIAAYDAAGASASASKDVGGLVGAVTGGGRISIEKSSASTVIGDSSENPAAGTTVGGLMGAVDSGCALSVASSYADSYLMGDVAGGLVGSYMGTSTALSIRASYAAGFMAWETSGAGLVARDSGQVTLLIGNSYSLMDKLSTSYAPGYSSRKGAYLPVAPSGWGKSEQEKHVCYLETGSTDSQRAYGAKAFAGTNDATALSALLEELNGGLDAGSAFLAGSPSDLPTESYGLMGQSLGTYMWPTVPGLQHFGDWSASFKPGALVYYEKYKDSEDPGSPTYGFVGGNAKDTLLDLGRKANKQRFSVVGDGYGVVFKEGAVPDSVAVTVWNPEDRNSPIATQVIERDSAAQEHYEVSYDGETYLVYPLDKAGVVNTSTVNKSGFFLEASVAPSGLQASSYYFNPHFARTVQEKTGDEVASLKSGNRIYIRTARQLNNLSRYYDDYHAFLKKTGSCTFYQERDIDYYEYEWSAFASRPKQKIQTSIAADGARPFAANYDGRGNEIANVSFESRENGLYDGLFGNISSGVTVQNVILCAEYDPAAEKNFYVRYNGELSNREAHLGVLAGYNAGTIDNCSVSGYYVTGSDGSLRTYNNATASIGGLVGTNAGKITNSAADSPRLRISALYSQIDAGGLVGKNTSRGKIRNCYSLGAIELVDGTGTDAQIAGFAGENDGYIASSYTATALAVSGDDARSYGFAPKGGSVSGCSYLSNGTYSYIGKMYSYNFNTSASSGSPVSFSQLKKARGKGPVDEDHTFNNTNTETTAKAYPYRGVVRTLDKTHYIHYGDWQDDVTLGTLGVFYWEHEENGNNNGYHMTYLGSVVSGSGTASVNEFVEGTSLCTTHDDGGGVITSYGYGFYVQSGQHVSAKWGAISCSSGESVGDVSTEAIECNEAASQDLKAQMQGIDTGGDAARNYNFYAFTTRTKAEARSDANSADYIALKSGEGCEDVQNGTLTLGYRQSANGKPVNYVFGISPFFANSLSVKAGGENGTPEDLLADAKGCYLEAADGTQTDYTKAPGTAAGTDPGNPYEVRSVDQLQYINWNGREGSVKKLVTRDNYRQFNYLLYTKSETTNSSKDGKVEDIAGEGSCERAELSWLQTHDAVPVRDSFTPIAGTYESSGNVNTGNNQGYNAVLYAWFGGIYDGQSYTIKNVNISSNSFNVGLFGSTVGARISNVIMYSDSTDNVIERRAEKDYPDKVGAYAIGGLVGVAFDYVVDSAKVKDSKNYIENCAISGYTVRDASSSQQGLGEANVGGLIGVANINLSRCSACVNIEDAATYGNGVALYGAFTRVGGLTGGAQGYIKDCYTGGSFTFDPAISSTVKWTGASNGKKALSIAVGGISGSAFTSNYMNLTGSGSVRDGEPEFVNCYTYFRFPTERPNDIAGQDKEPALIMSTIASHADRLDEGNAKKLTVTNCYYLDSVKTAGVEEQLVSSNSGYKWKVSGAPHSVSYTQMNVFSEAKTSEETDARKVTGDGDKVWKDFSAALNNGRAKDGPWEAVTTRDNGGSIVNGKFSFPFSKALEEKNYPFPTVVRQNDLAFGTASNPVWAHVHYGDWPIVDASYWEVGRASIDLLADNADPGSKSSYAEKTFKLRVEQKDYEGTDPKKSDFTFEPAGIAEVSDISALPAEDGARVYEVRVRALKEGTATVTLNDTAAVFSLRVKASLSLAAAAASPSDTLFDGNSNTLVLEEGGTKALNLSASDANGKGLAGVQWALAGTSEGDAQVNVTVDALDNDNKQLTVTRRGAAEVLLTLDATIAYPGYADGIGKQLILTIADPDVIGISNGKDFVQVSNTKTTGQKWEDVTGSLEDKPSLEGDDGRLFLYCTTNNELSFKDFYDVASRIDHFEIAKEGADSTQRVSYKSGEYDAGKDFYVSVAGEATQSGSYKCLPVTITYNKEKPSGTYEVRAVLDNGSVLPVAIEGEDIAKTKCETLTFASGSLAPVTRQLPAGAKYQFEDYAALFSGASAQSKERFDEWNAQGTGKYYKPSAVYTVASGGAAFEATFKKALTLEVAASSGSTPRLEKTFYVGRDGIQSLGSAYDDVRGDDLFSSHRLDGWYDGVEDTSARVVNAGGSIAAQGDFCDGKGTVEDGRLTLKADVTLYAAMATWSLATEITEGGEYLIGSAGAYSASQTSATLATSPDKTEANRYPDSKFTATTPPTSPAYGLSQSAVELSGTGPLVSAAVGDEAVWRATKNEDYGSGTSAKTYYALSNLKTGLYLSDSGGCDSNNSYWFIAGIESIEGNPPLSIGGFSNLKNTSRSSFTVGSDGVLKTFNKPTSNNSVNFRIGDNNHQGVLYAALGGNNPLAYLYAKSLVFEW